MNPVQIAPGPPVVQAQMHTVDAGALRQALEASIEGEVRFDKV
jgi:hypothetical protein